MGPINILMVIDMKVIGAMIFRVESELIIIPTVISIRVNGLMENLMEKETISIMGIKECIRVTGRMEKRKALENLSSMISMAILESGRITRKMGEGHISIQMDNDTRETGFETRKMEGECTNTEMGISTMVHGRMTEDKEMEP